MSWCLPQKQAQAFKDALKRGDIVPEKLIGMSSEGRRAFFNDIVGEKDAAQVNAELERKLILKDQQRGMVTWAKKLSGITEARRNDLISKIEKIDNILNPKDERAFLEDLVAKKLGTEVSFEEAQKIHELSQQVQASQGAMNRGGDRLDYGRAKVALGNYVSDLTNANRPGLSIKRPGQALNELAGTAKGLKASMDNSAIFRQGWKTMFTNPAIWMKNAKTSFSDLVRQFGGKEVMDEVQADIQSRPTYEQMRTAKLDTGTTEEQFPSHLVEKIPGIGRAYKASEAAYTGFVYRMRADVFDKYLKVAETAGVDVTDKTQLESIGKLVNSLTGRGDLGPVGEKAASAVNNILFSPRFLKSNLDFLTAHQLQKGVTPFVRKQAAVNLMKVVLGTATILAIAKAINPDSVETDARSSNFGKIKVGNTTFDVSGGMSSLLTLGAKLSTMSSKSALTGKLSKLNTGKYGAQTGADVFVNFAEGKLSPIAGVVRDYLKGQDPNFNKLTVPGEAYNLLTPIPITNAVQLTQAKDAPVLMGIIADALGISVNPLSKPPKQ